MVQKQREKNSDSKMDKVADGLSKSIDSKTSSGRGGTAKRLYKAVTKEGDTQEAAVAGSVTGLMGLVVAGVLPFTILPMLAGFGLGGWLLGKTSPNKVHSVLGGTAVSSFITFFLAVNIPILGLGLISTVLFSVLATGAAVSLYEYSS